MQLRIWAMGIQLRNKENRILQLEQYNVYLTKRNVFFHTSAPVYKMLRGYQ